MSTAAGVCASPSRACLLACYSAELGQEKERLKETVEVLKAENAELQAQRQHQEIEQREQAEQIAELQAQLSTIAGRLKRLDRPGQLALVDEKGFIAAAALALENVGWHGFAPLDRTKKG